MASGITRRVLASSVAGACFLAAGAVAQAQTVELKVSHYLPPNHTFQKELVRWGEELSAQSGGRLKLNIFPASQLGPVNRQFDLARNGVVDIAVGLHGATPGRYPTTELVSLPYVHPKAGDNSAVTSKRLSELAPEYLAAEHNGLKILWMAVTNPLKFHTANKQIKTVADFKGLRIRYAGEQFAQIIPALGAVPLPVPQPLAYLGPAPASIFGTGSSAGATGTFNPTTTSTSVSSFVASGLSSSGGGASASPQPHTHERR